MPLGIVADTGFASETVDLPKDCRVMLYTDGITEAMNGAGERSGQERFAEWLPPARGRYASEPQDELAEKLRQFQAKTGLNDDQTFLMMTE